MEHTPQGRGEKLHAPQNSTPAAAHAPAGVFIPRRRSFLLKFRNRPDFPGRTDMRAERLALRHDQGVQKCRSSFPGVPLASSPPLMLRLAHLSTPRRIRHAIQPAAALSWPSPVRSSPPGHSRCHMQTPGAAPVGSSAQAKARGFAVLPPDTFGGGGGEQREPEGAAASNQDNSVRGTQHTPLRLLPIDYSLLPFPLLLSNAQRLLPFPLPVPLPIPFCLPHPS